VRADDLREAPAPHVTRPADRRGRDRALLAAAALASFLPFLGQTHDVAAREMRHAEIARETAAHGNFAVPTLLGEPYVDKPPVLSAAVATLYALGGGPSLALARLPSVLAAVAGILLLHGLALWLAGAETAALAGWALLGTVGWQHMARVARPDMIMAAAILAASLAAVRGLAATGRRRRLLLVLAGAAAGLAVLAKGPFGVGVPGLVALAALLMHRDRLRWPGAVDVACAAAGMAVVLACWAVPAWRHDGGAYVHGVLAQRDLTWQGDEEARSVWLYLVALPLGALPWTPFAPLVVRDVRRRGWTLAAVVAVALFAVLVVAPKKRPHYLLPMYPFVALAAAEAAVRAGPRARRTAHALAGAVAVAAPLWIGIGPGTGHGNVRPATALLERATPRAPIVCLSGLGEELAFLGRRDDVTMVSELRALAARAAANGAGSFVVVPTWGLPRAVRRLRRVVTIDEVARAARPEQHGAQGWILFRVR
jgi:4-amino-4-deoxy-L-arabinose transferase-like glycosyltransferase